MRWLTLTAILAFGIDQLSKWWALEILRLPEVLRVDVLPPLLVFRLGYNDGINFGLFGEGSSGQAVFLVLLALALCIALLLWARKQFTRPVAFASAGLVIGGALANALDRLIHPGVVDFLNMSCCGIANPYLFNIADVFIFAGAFGLILFTGGEDGDRGEKAA